MLCLVVLGLGGYYLEKRSSNKNLASEPNPTPVPATPSRISDQLANWTSYDIITEPLLGYVDYTVKVPPSWKRIEHSSNFQDTETFQDTYGQYKLVIHQDKNYNSRTGKPYATLREVTSFPHDVTTLIVDGQPAARVLPRAGLESIYKVLFFSKDNKSVFSIELETPEDGSKVKEGEDLFNQILSTFKFLDKAIKPILPPISKEGWSIYNNTKNYYSISYPSDWQVDDYKGVFVGIPGEVTFTPPSELSIQVESFRTKIAITMMTTEKIRYSLNTQELFNEWLAKSVSNGQGKRLYKSGDITIDGYKAVKFINRTLPGDATKPFYSIVVWLRKDGANYYFELCCDENKILQYVTTFDKMLESVKFTQ